jgi:hypothetical protein
MVAPSFFGNWIKGPDFHGADIAAEKLTRKLHRLTKEVYSVIAGVVDANRLPGRAAQKLIDRLAGDFAEKIPERDIDSADRPHFGRRPSRYTKHQETYLPRADRWRLGPGPAARVPTCDALRQLRLRHWG